MSKTRIEAKRYIYRCLATTLQNDWSDLGAGYLRALVVDEPEDETMVGLHEGKKLRQATVAKIVQEVVDELRRRAGENLRRSEP